MSFLLALLMIFSEMQIQAVSAKCYTSISGIALTGHAFSSFPCLDIHQCFFQCKEDIRCQSITYLVDSKMCELNNRTIATRPENSLSDVNAVYFENPNRAMLGSSERVPAVSCKEIKMSGSTSSGRYWLDTTQSGNASTAYCNMMTEKVEECNGGSCQHGGTCTYYGRGLYTCACVPGITGANCETNINECSSNPCRNGATCTDQVNGYKCNCQPGYTGQQCETDINDCSSSPCLNGASCINGINQYTCTCQPDYSGDRCQTYTDPCTAYTSISDNDRSINFVTTSRKCDRSGEFTKGWYRFTSSAGIKMPTSCVPVQRCQADAPGWVDGTLPSSNGDVVSRRACFHWSGSCCKWATNIRIKHCGAFYVFELVPVICYSRYCVTP